MISMMMIANTDMKDYYTGAAFVEAIPHILLVFYICFKKYYRKLW